MAWQDALGTAASISSLLQIACEVTKFGYSYFSNVRDAHVTREEYLRESRALVVVLLQLKQVLNSSDVQRHQDAATRARSAQLSAVMSDCERGLSKIEATLGKAVGFWRALWPLQQEQIRDHIKTFQQYRCMLDSFVSANVLATTTATLTKIDPLVLSHERTQLLFAFPQPDTISKPRVLTCPGTGKWFLDSVHYQQWLSKSSPVRFIWCHGPPGVGKSGLASLVIDELMEQQCQGQIHLCYFFSDFAAQEKQHLVGVLQCLVYQLIEQGDEEVVNCAKESLGHFDAFKSPNILAKVIAKIAGLAKPVFLVLDAEDELNCRERLRKYMLGFRNSGCRILITSRDKCSCESNTTTPSPMTNLELKMECPVEDIMKYATERFQQSPFQFQISVDLMNQIVQKSNSIFLIAHILIEHILKQTSVRDMKKVLEESPTELNEVFESSLRRINNQPPAFSRLAHRVIGWIINARQLLTVAAMTHGFAVEDGMDEVDQDGLTNSVLILRVCAGLVIIDETKTVRLVHTSVYEFFSAYKPSLEEVQVDIARSCIQYLCLKPMRNGPAKDVSELRNRLENLPFLHYASHHWGAHIRDESAEEQLRSLILGLLTHENTRWSAVQSLQFNSEVGNTTIAAEFFASIPTNQAALHLSAYWGLSSISRSLIHSGADETPCDSELWTPLHWAAANGHDRVVAVLIEAKCDLNAKDSEGWTPLFWASFHGHISIVHVLLRAGADHRAKSHRGLTALDWSIWRDELEIARILLLHNQLGSKVPPNMNNTNISMQDLQDIGKRLGLEYFRGDGYFRYIEQFIDGDEYYDHLVAFPIKKLKVGEITDKEDSMRPIFRGYRSSSSILDIHGQFGPPVSKSIWRTYAKTKVAASRKDLFIKNPANWKSNLLQSAIMTGDLAPARLLVELGADVNARGDGLCPIFAALDADDPQFLELLITNGADASFIHEGDNMVTKVVRSKSEAKLSLLSMVLKHGADPNWSKEDCTPLMCAALRGFKQAAEMCQILILHGALVNARNSEDKTALHFSVKENNVNPLKVLLSHGADVNARDQNGESALHTAAGYFSRGKFDHYFDTQELLLQSGADQTIKNLAGKLPFQEFLIRLCDMWHPEVGILQNHIQLFARFSPSPSDLVATACADGEAIKRAAELEDSAILKVLLSHGVPSSGDILRECIYSSIYHTRPQSLRVLMKHANLFRVANSKHLSFLFLIKISRDIHRCCHSNPDVNISMEARVRTAKSLPLQHPRLFISTDKHCEILKDIWNAGFDTNTILDERFVSLVSTYDDEFSSLVRDAEQFGNPISSPGRETISAVVYAAQHIPSAMVVLALLKVNSHRDNLTDEGILEAFIRSAIYDNLEVYDACRNGFLGRIDGGGSEDCQSRETSGGTFKRHISQELRRIAEGFPFSGGRGGPDFYIALCQAMRAEGFEKKTFSCGRTLFELAERAENWRLLNLLRDGIPL